MMIPSVIFPVILSVIPKSDKITDRIMDRITDRLMGKKWHNVILCLSLILYLILCIREELNRIRYGIIHRIINKHDINLPFPRAVLASKHHLITVDFYLWKRWSGWHCSGVPHSIAQRINSEKVNPFGFQRFLCRDANALNFSRPRLYFSAPITGSSQRTPWTGRLSNDNSHKFNSSMYS